MGQHALRSDFGVASLLAVTERLLLLGPVTPNVILDAHYLTVSCTRVLVWPQGIATHRSDGLQDFGTGGHGLPCQQCHHVVT